MSLVEDGLLLVCLGLVPVVDRGVEVLLDVAEVAVDVERLDEVLRVDVPPVDGVGGHVGAEIPDADGVVGAAGDEGARREDGLRLAAVRHRRRVHLQAPDARRVEDERVGLADLKLGRGADDTFSTV